MLFLLESDRLDFKYVGVTWECGVILYFENRRLVKLKIVMMNGGLANQTFQYIFLRYIELFSGETCFVDDSRFWVEDPPHNGYELEKLFGVTPRMLSAHFGREAWGDMLNKRDQGYSIPQQLYDSGVPLTLIAEASNFEFNGNKMYVPTNSFSPFVADVAGDFYYHGYWINKGWLQMYRDIIIKELQFPAMRDSYNIEMAKRVQGENSVAIHVRRGDFIEAKRTLPPQYYYNSILHLEQKLNDARYYIFSDDIFWCRRNASAMGFDLVKGRIEYINKNKKEKAYLDLQLMSMCKNAVLCNSSFSYLA